MRNMYKAKILLVEDESLIALGLKRALQAAGFMVPGVLRRGEDAITAALEIEPDLILMDIMLSGQITGIEAAVEIKKSLNVPIIYLTSYADEDTRRKAKVTEPYGYIIKPYEEENLFVTIEMALYKHKMEMNLQQSEQRYRTLVEHSPVAIVLHSDGKIVFANPAAAALAAVASQDELIGVDIIKFVHPSYVDEVLGRIKKIYAGSEEIETFKQQLIINNGKIIDVETSSIATVYKGKPAAQAILRDITEETSKNKLQQTILKISQAADSTDSLDELFVYVHQTLEEYIPVKHFFIALYDDVKNSINFPYYSDEHENNPSDRPFSKGLTEYVIRNKKSFLYTWEEIEKLISDKEVVAFQPRVKKWLGVPLQVKDKILGALIVKEYENEEILEEEHRNILELLSFPISHALERKVTEEQRRLYTVKLKEMNEAKDKYFSVVSHDLKSPFHAIMGFAEILQNDYGALSEQERVYCVSALNDSIKHISVMLDNLLQFSKFQLGKVDFDPQKISLLKIIQNNVDLLKGNAVKKQINILQLFNENLEVWADENMINSVIQNLLSNAIKFTSPNGNIIIEGNRKDGFAEISFKDNGVGIDEKKLLEMFQYKIGKSSLGTADEKGTGLGLILTKEFIEKNGGELSFYSRKGQGSCFSFKLPLAEENKN